MNLKIMEGKTVASVGHDTIFEFPGSETPALDQLCINLTDGSYLELRGLDLFEFEFVPSQCKENS